eukprot:TRINITY_DN218_c0_g1_i1.p3 TRINITY_DN218_c0_g1~~TRINITY_DN218_c0_g1_i1.p3  ORF type:complete len:187 (-),score=11.67 TRINITY_DN218_c0_g1_i1:1024-1584(-)
MLRKKKKPFETTNSLRSIDRSNGEKLRNNIAAMNIVVAMAQLQREHHVDGTGPVQTSTIPGMLASFLENAAESDWTSWVDPFDNSSDLWMACNVNVRIDSNTEIIVVCYFRRKTMQHRPSLSVLFDIEVPDGFQRKGYASAVLDWLQQTFPFVVVFPLINDLFDGILERRQYKPVIAGMRMWRRPA